jgi:modulator of FtsH protease
LDATSIAGWNTYLSAQAGVGATLTGLVFVAVSINLPRVLSVPGLTGRAAESILQLFGVVIVSTTALVPGQSQVVLGAEMLAFGFALWAIQSALQIRYMRSKTGHPRWWAVMRIVQTHFATVPFVVCGILLLRDMPAGLYWLAPGCGFSLIAGVLSAWILLIEILR